MIRADNWSLWDSDAEGLECLHVSPQLLEQNDGPMLEALKKLQGSVFTFQDVRRTIRTAIDCRCGLSDSRLRTEHKVWAGVGAAWGAIEIAGRADRYAMEAVSTVSRAVEW